MPRRNHSRKHRRSGPGKKPDHFTQSPYLRHPLKKWGKRELLTRAREMLRLDADLCAEARDSQAMSPCQTLAGSMLATETAAKRAECEEAVALALALEPGDDAGQEKRP